MKVKFIFVVLFILLLAASLFLFYLIPSNVIDFGVKSGNYNFSTVSENESMQFYSNMRFPHSEISYRIFDCPLKKQNDMEYAFSIMKNLTSLEFYPVNIKEEISITCQQKETITNGLFIAGEGGPSNVTIAGEFSVITYGEILLIKESDCQNPNIALHELFHVLGFKHSTNKKNIMYNISKCDQTIGKDMLQLIDDLYSISDYPDLVFEEASAKMSGRFLSLNVTIINAGLDNAGDSNVEIYADGSLIKKIDLEPFEIGSGRIITIENIFVAQINVKELELIINNNFNELNKDNNKIKLEIK